jgi:hypothetical protein
VSSKEETMSFIVAIHDVSDPDRFWGGAGETLAQLPTGVTLLTSYPQQDGTRAVCLWDAPSVDAVRDIVDTAAGDSSRNEYFAVDPQHPGARGVPTQAATAR